MTTDVTAIVETLAAAAVDAYYADRRAAVMPFYLWYKTGALAFLPDGFPALEDGWTLADSQAHRGSLPRHQLFNQTRELARRLPILPV